MPRALRILLILLTAGGFIFFLFMAIGYRFVTRSLPTVAGTIHVAGLEQSVEVYRDDVHVPHILAKTEADLFFAQGFVTAQDRLWQMDFRRRMASGRLSDIFGESAQKTDSLMQTVGLDRSARDLASRLDPQTTAMLSAYTQGVNAYLKTHAGRLPMEFKLLNYHPESWKIEDCLAIQALYVWMKDASWRMRPLIHAVIGKTGLENGMRLFPGLDEKLLLPADRDRADTTLLKKLESVFKEGFIPPAPGEDLAWILAGDRTVSGHSILATRPGFAPILPALWYEVHLSGAGLDVTGFTLPGFPGILHGHNRQIAWTTVHQHTIVPPDFTAWPRMQYGIMRAGDVKEAGKILSRFSDSSLLFLCTDSGGGVWPSSFGTRGWRTYSSGGSRTFTEKRLEQRLGEKQKLSAFDIQNLLSDRVSVFAQGMLEQIRPVFESIPPKNDVERAASQKLLSWDGSFRPGSGEAAMFAVFLENYFLDLWSESLGKTASTAYARLGDIPLEVLRTAIENPKNEERIKAAWQKTVEHLQRQFGTDADAWSWGAYQQIAFHHPIRIHPLLSMVYDLGPFSIGGSGETLEGIAHAWDSPERVTACPSGRMIIDVGSGLSVSILPTGQSGQPLDPHYSDQIQGFLSNQFHPILTDSLRIVHTGWEHLTLTSEDGHEKKRLPQHPGI